VSGIADFGGFHLGANADGDAVVHATAADDITLISIQASRLGWVDFVFLACSSDHPRRGLARLPALRAVLA
jgi:hypothetical protein